MPFEQCSFIQQLRIEPPTQPKHCSSKHWEYSSKQDRYIPALMRLIFQWGECYVIAEQMNTTQAF